MVQLWVVHSMSLSWDADATWRQFDALPATQYTNFPVSDDLAVPKKFFCEFSTNFFARPKKIFFILQTASINKMHLYRLCDIWTTVSKLLWKNSSENFLSSHVDGKHNLHTASSFKLTKRKTTLLTQLPI